MTCLDLVGVNFDPLATYEITPLEDLEVDVADFRELLANYALETVHLVAERRDHRARVLHKSTSSSSQLLLQRLGVELRALQAPPRENLSVEIYLCLEAASVRSDDNRLDIVYGEDNRVRFEHCHDARDATLGQRRPHQQIPVLLDERHGDAAEEAPDHDRSARVVYRVARDIGRKQAARGDRAAHDCHAILHQHRDVCHVGPSREIITEGVSPAFFASRRHSSSATENE
eukprot:CAMPEP_0180196910 /NCGR_PEP_ID=MMETSP0987-20121128/4358_1 /TAXON_ID=697907 /ORGANISM="non described non described, Strain CCMP2293" /LENGTH=229 /DNA_ID=CAMNT_0022151821 /DNA_START=13 /DNA_END=702 /DNA_ORIENTATION=-